MITIKVSWCPEISPYIISFDCVEIIWDAGNDLRYMNINGIKEGTPWDSKIEISPIWIHNIDKLIFVEKLI